MNPVYFSIGLHRMVQDVWDSIWRPRVLRPRPPVVFMHGAGTHPVMARQMNRTEGEMGIRQTMMFLASEGYAPVCISAPNTWGNATLVSRVDAAIAYARTNLGATNDPAILIGASHGGLCALRYAYERPADTGCVVGIIGVMDLDDVRDNDLWSLRAPIDAAWGVTYPTPLPAGANPADNTTSFANVPIQWHYASDDPVAREATILAFDTAVNNMTAINLGALGHTDPALIAVDEPTVLSFIEANT